MQSTLVFGDLHLCSEGNPDAAAALVTLLARHPDAPLVFAGDTLDLAAERTDDPAEAARRALRAAPMLVKALSERAARGVTTTLLAGNHDAAIAAPEVTRAIHQELSLEGDARWAVRTEPWFVRIPTRGGDVHVEHGHCFDADGAPAHPLAPELRDDVGIRLFRRFVVPVGAQSLVHANAEPPLALLARVVRMYGARAPAIVAGYVRVAAAICNESGARFPLVSDRAFGAAQLADFAATRGLDRETLARMADAHATPTMANATATFLRLYLDRVAATSALIGGAAVALAPSPFGALGASVAVLGAVSLAASLVAGADRYGGRARRSLAAGAETVAEITGARTVVFGHVHVAERGDRYRNTGSFGYGADRTHLRIDERGEVTLAAMPAHSA